jgi:hypothetical protein
MILGGGWPGKRRQMSIDHLDRRHLVQDRPRRQSRYPRSQPLFQGNLQAVSQERDQDVRFDPLTSLMVDRADCQIVLQFFEGLLHLGQLQVERRELCWIAAGQIRPHQVTPFAATGFAQVLPVQPKPTVSGVTA